MAKQKARKVRCGCGRRFIDSQSRSRHIRDSPLHQQPVAGVADIDPTPAPAGESFDETQELSTGKETESAGRLYTIKAIDGKGKGLVAATKILKGTRILSEVPVFRIPRNTSSIKASERIVEKEVECLNPDQQRTFFDLANTYVNTQSRTFGIAKANVLPLGSNASFGGLFPEASRINHSCEHNSQNTWNENIGQLTIHALRDIEEGQGITITYLEITSEYADRQRFLREKFKFECKCKLCSLPPAQKKVSNSRLREIQAIDSLIGNFFWGGLESERALQLLHKMLGLIEKEGIWDGTIARAYKDAYEIALKSGDVARARVFAERTYDARRVIEGDDSPVTMKMKRATERLSAEAPELSGDGFENWLWMLTSS